jgi:cyanophycin synthetase
VGLTTTDGIWIGDHKIVSGDTTGPHSTGMVLSDPSVESAVLEVARGGLLRGGLGYDWSDVSVVTNIREDHLGQDGIEDVEDLVWIKSLVAERVCRGGWVVLNADDDNSVGLRESRRMKKIERNFFLYSTDVQNPKLIAHLTQGGSACWREDGWIYLQHDKVARRILSVDEISLTMNGAAEFQISNVLAAIAASWCMNKPVEQIQKGILQFDPIQDNMGRMNVYKVGKGHVIMDYGHNPDAFDSFAKVINHYKGYKKTAIIGLPGDRSDDLIKESAQKIAENFHRIILRDDYCLRGRKPGEIPGLIESHLRKAQVRAYCDIVLDEKEAMDLVLGSIRADDIVVIFYDEFKEAMKNLLQYDPQPVSSLPLIESGSQRYTEFSQEPLSFVPSSRKVGEEWSNL